MPDLPAFAPALPAARESEALFARGDDDALIRREKKTLADFDTTIKLRIDGHDVEVPKAVPATDAQGNVRYGKDGNPIPRATTIYDAAAVLTDRLTREGTWPHGELARRIPVLCHQDHLDPVAVCRMCSVHVSKMRKRDRGNPNARPVPADKLVPACQHEVQEDMIVTTRCGAGSGPDTEKFAAQVGKATGLLTELLLADHRHPDPVRDDRHRNELEAVAAALGVDEPRPALRRQHERNARLHPRSRPLPVLADDGRPFPYSSRSITVDHDRCILCDRCARSCSEVKPFKVIGHTGKGYKSRISFDLDQVMGQSSCVQCGECMTACPTGALTLNRRVNPLGSWPDARDLDRQAERLDPDYVPPTAEDARHPYPHLTRFNDPAVPFPPDFPARGDHFPSAAELRDVVLTYREPGRDPQLPPLEYRPFEEIPLPYLRWNEGGVRRRAVRPGDVLCRNGEFGSTAFLLESGAYEIVIGGTARRDPERVVATVRGEADLIVGEMACLTHTRRNATVRCAEPGVAYEVTRNILDMIQRTRAGRRVLDQFYLPRAVRDCLDRGGLFQDLTPEDRAAVLNEVRGEAELLRVDPGQEVVREGDAVGLDSAGQHRGDLYLVRLGSAEVFRSADGTPRVLARVTRNGYVGEIALLYPELEADAAAEPDPERRRFKQGVLRRTPRNRRTATVRALDDVEVVRVRGDAFRRLLEARPGLRDRLVNRAWAQLGAQRAAPPPLLGAYLAQGFFQGQRMLALDLERCTRCDECTKACADAHGDGHSRLLREGPRFGRFLVATSCRSCHTPYCMNGCPVDAIHRGAASLEVRVDAHCIGCGLCATNCPYESIQLMPRDATPGAPRKAEVRERAVNCDLCQGLVPAGAEPFCVSSCPHDAAFRLDGEELYRRATGERAGA